MLPGSSLLLLVVVGVVVVEAVVMVELIVGSWYFTQKSTCKCTQEEKLERGILHYIF